MFQAVIDQLSHVRKGGPQYGQLAKQMKSQAKEMIKVSLIISELLRLVFKKLLTVQLHCPCLASEREGSK